MATEFFPTREAEVVTWSTNFKTKITATPTAYGLTAPQATAYGALHDTFVADYQTASNPDTRSPSAIIAKDQALFNLGANARMLARIVQASPAVTNAQKSDLGLTVRHARAPIPAPSSAPDIDVVSVSGNTVRIRLHDAANPTRRGKPAGVAGAAIFSFVGAGAPTDESAWTFEGTATRTTLLIVFPPATPPGARVWFTARWFNPRQENGPAAVPVGTNIPGDAAMAA